MSDEGGDVARGYARSAARNDEARAALEPLGEGERPGAVTAAVVVAVVLAIGVLAGALTVDDLADEGGSLPGGIVLAGVFVFVAAGMWRVRYWAVLGFQAFLTFQVIVTGIALIVASTWWGALTCLVVIGGSGFLFYKLVRAMARIQMAER